MEKKVKITSRLLPEMVATARLVHKGDIEIRTAVLGAWTALAGVLGWTPKMVAAVEREMAR